MRPKIKITDGTETLVVQFTDEQLVADRRALDRPRDVVNKRVEKLMKRKHKETSLPRASRTTT